MNVQNDDLRIRHRSVRFSAEFLRRLQKKADRRLERLRQQGRLTKPAQSTV